MANSDTMELDKNWDRPWERRSLNLEDQVEKSIGYQWALSEASPAIVMRHEY